VVSAVRGALVHSWVDHIEGRLHTLGLCHDFDTVMARYTL